jgi:MFS transporter, OFA family, oxalate/formate antiporter
MAFAPISPALPRAQASADYRWMQLILGVACMVAAANIQYAWTLFVPEIQRASIQTAFTLFILVQTWLTPLEGYLIDRFGPRIIVLIGGFFTGLAWIIDSYATSLTGYYVGAMIGGIGVGCVYATCVNNAIKCSPIGAASRSALPPEPMASGLPSRSFRSPT